MFNKGTMFNTHWYKYRFCRIYIYYKLVKIDLKNVSAYNHIEAYCCRRTVFALCLCHGIINRGLNLAETLTKINLLCFGNPGFNSVVQSITT